MEFLGVCRLAIMRLNLRAEELFEAAITVRPLQPSGDSKGVLLVRRSPCAWESPAPQRRVDLCNHRAIRGQTPTIEERSIGRPRKRADL
jgi:hypothetical protein